MLEFNYQSNEKRKKIFMKINILDIFTNFNLKNSKIWILIYLKGILKKTLNKTLKLTLLSTWIQKNSEVGVIQLIPTWHSVLFFSILIHLKLQENFVKDNENTKEKFEKILNNE